MKIILIGLTSKRLFWMGQREKTIPMIHEGKLDAASGALSPRTLHQTLTAMDRVTQDTWHDDTRV